MSRNFAVYPSLSEKTVFVTGGASGIGASIVENFLQQGSKVAFLDKEENLGKNLVKDLSNFKHKPVFKHCDVTNITKLKNTIDQIKDELGMISILVNNAAGNFISPTERLSHKGFDVVVDIVLKGTYNFSLAVG